MQITELSHIIDEIDSIILPIYLSHEETFDKIGVHSRMHVSRAFIFAEIMMNYYEKNHYVKVDRLAVWYATIFHDVGRKRNGIDIWERKSARKCYYYLKKRYKTEDKMYIKEISSIIKGKKFPNNAECQLLHDADVLEIMRPCCGHNGIYGFKKDNLKFLSKADIIINTPELSVSDREQFISEAWMLIRLTEDIKLKLKGNNKYLRFLFEFIKSKEEQFKFMNNYLCLIQQNK